jgi:hypothetical protein
MTDFGEELGVGQRTGGGLLQDEIETSVGNESDSGGDSGSDDSLSQRVNDITGGGNDNSLGDQVNDIVDDDISPPSTNTGANDPDRGSDGELGFGIVDDSTIPGVEFGEELGGSPVDSGGSDNNDSVDIGGGSDGDLQAGTDPDAGDNPGGGSSAGTAPVPDQTQEEEPDPADIRVMGLGFTSSTLRVGQTETARVRFRNFGGQTGTADRTLLGNGQPLGVVSATVAPGETQVDTIDFTVPRTDRFELSFQDDYYNTAAAKNVEPKPAEGTLSPNIEAPNGAMVGETFNVDVTVEAAGGRVDATESLNVKVGGRTVLTDSVGPLSEGEVYRRPLSVTAQEAGETPVVLNVGDSQTSDRIQIEPEPTAEFRADPIEVVTNGQPGELTQVRVTVRNTGDGTGDITVPVLVDGVQVASVPFVSVAPGEAASNTASYTTPSSGSYTLALGGLGPSTNVEPQQPEQQEPQQPGDGGSTPPQQGGGIIGGFSNRQLAIGAGLAAGSVVLSSLGGN